MKTLLTAAGALLISTAIWAQQLPPALSETTVRTSDSPMVAAAKRGAAARRLPAEQTGIVIDDSMVSHRVMPRTNDTSSAELVERIYRQLACSVTRLPSTFSIETRPAVDPDCPPVAPAAAPQEKKER